MTLLWYTNLLFNINIRDLVFALIFHLIDFTPIKNFNLLFSKIVTVKFRLYPSLIVLVFSKDLRLIIIRN